MSSFYLMHKDTTVCKIELSRSYVEVYNNTLLPMCMKNRDNLFNGFITFCSNRILMYNRENTKEILLECGIDDQSPLNICLVIRGLSFTDFYWLKSEDSNDSWSSVNLFQNELELDISLVALCGKVITDKLRKSFLTGELTGKGTRAKGFFKRNGKIFLVKKMTTTEINAEIYSYIVSKIVNVDSTRYFGIEDSGNTYSYCEIGTSLFREMVHCRSIETYFNENNSKIGNNTYELFMRVDPYNFTKMQLLDYLTLNSDRNRDNYSLVICEGEFQRLFTLFDHDSCFKGKSTKAHYFVSGVTFEDTLKYLKTLSEYNYIRNDIIQQRDIVLSKEFANASKQFISSDQLSGLIDRYFDIIGG